jgi:peptide/nickel transport system substrate-binding protein
VGELTGIVPLHYEVSSWAMRRNLAYKARADQSTFAFEVMPAK